MLFVDNTKGHPELFLYLPWGPFPTVDVFNQWYTSRVVPDPTQLLFAVYNKREEGQDNEFAGMVTIVFVVVIPKGVWLVWLAWPITAILRIDQDKIWFRRIVSFVSRCLTALLFLHNLLSLNNTTAARYFLLFY